MKKVFQLIQLCLVGLIIASCTQEQRPTTGLLSHWNSKYPTSAQDLNLVDSVQSIRVKTYEAIQDGDKYAQGEIKAIEYAWEAQGTSYEMEFAKDGSINHISMLSNSGNVFEKKVSIISPEGQYIGFFNYDEQGNPVFKAEYSYNGDTLMMIKRNLEMSEGYWQVEFSYPHAEEINYTEEFYEGMCETRELLVDNKVQQMWEKQVAEGDTEEKHHTYMYNTYNDIIHDHVVRNSTYLDAPEGYNGQSTYDMTYQYTYDSKGNWKTKVVIKDGKALDYLVREIVYY